MTASLDAALSGMVQQQRNIELIANNLANVNTAGYKRAVVRFQDALDTAEILGYVAGDIPASQVSTSSGVEGGAVERVFAQGALRPSDDPLDMAVVGRGFFRLRLDSATAVLGAGGGGAVSSIAGQPADQTAGVYAIETTAAGAVTLTFTPDDGSPPTVTAATVVPGEQNSTLIDGVTISFRDPLADGAHTIRISSRAYTRDGAFRLDGDGRLVTPLGTLVQPPIVFPPDYEGVVVQADGTLLIRRPHTAQELADLPPDAPRDGVIESIGRLELTRFDVPTGLVSIGNNLYVESALAAPTDGFPGEAGMGTVAGGFLEASNVDLAEEMSALMIASRVYQMNLAAYRTIQEMLEQAVQLA